ncbi:MAG: hypothetical protein ACPGJS_09520 [Flammeovirgaceae bacterium]
MQDLIILTLFIICLIPAYLLRKHIGFMFCPDDVIGVQFRLGIFAVFCLMPALFMMMFMVIEFRAYAQTIESLQPYENYSLVLGLITLPIWGIFTGMLTEKVMYHVHGSYRAWRDECNKNAHDE